MKDEADSDGKREAGAPNETGAMCRRKDFKSIGKIIKDTEDVVILESIMNHDRSRWVLVKTKNKTKWFLKA